MGYEEYLQNEVLKPAGCYDMHLAYNYYEQRHPGEVRYYGHDDERIESYDGSGMLRPREYGGNNIRGLQGAGAWVASSAELMRLVASIDGKDGVEDILSKESVEEMKCINGRTLGWADYIAGNDALVRTGTMSGTCAYIYLRNNGLSFVFLTNTSHYRGASFTTSMGRMVRDAMARVKEWPTDVYLFVRTPASVESELKSDEPSNGLS
jgi:CubicO group peptidase (beta-lactamase class C family)